MKKAKIMLSAITVFAVVGGALAFKAAKFNQPFCTAPTNQVGSACKGSLVGKTTSDANVASYKFVTTSDVGDCLNNSGCSAITRITTQEN